MAFQYDREHEKHRATSPELGQEIRQKHTFTLYMSLCRRRHCCGDCCISNASAVSKRITPDHVLIWMGARSEIEAKHKP